MVDTRTDYSADAVAAARAVMLELVRLLGEYRDEIVIVGGWVPELLLPLARPGHIGSTDVDLALDHRRITEAGYQTIREKFLSPTHIGPKSVADFEEVTDREARDLRHRDAFERVDHLLGRLGVA